MKKILIAFVFLAIFLPVFSATIYQAETGTLNGTNVSTALAGYQGTGYVDGWDTAGDYCQVNVNVAAAGMYTITIGFAGVMGAKVNDLYANGVFQAAVSFPATSGFQSITAGMVPLNAGNNTLRIQNNWGYFYLDWFGIEPATLPSLLVSKNLVNANSTAVTKCLMSYLVDNYGTYTLAGQCGDTDAVWCNTNTGHYPAVGGFDMMDYSPSRVARGTTSTEVEKAIAWYQAGGIVQFQWHWNAPMHLIDTTGFEWWRGFYTDSTTYDLQYALANTGSPEYIALISDIDAIAVQLKRLRDAGVPILWRPLHEAQGGWFWWGAKGPAACVQLYHIMYDRLTNYHGLNNLIWVWTTQDNTDSPNWYPGDTYVDIVGADIYLTGLNYSPSTSMFYNIVNMFGGGKMVAMTETGTIPDADQMSAQHAHWSYFLTWNGFENNTAQNSVAHVNTVYDHSYIITREELVGVYACAIGTPTFTPSRTRTATVTPTRSSTYTPVITMTFTRTRTPVNTATRTNTAVDTYTNTPVNTLTFTRTATVTITRTASPSASATSSATSSVSPTVIITNTPTSTSTSSVQITSTSSVSPTRTYTVTQTRTNSVSPQNTNTRTPTRTATPTGTPSATASVSPQNTNTRTPTATGTFTITKTFTAGPSGTPTATGTKTDTPVVFSPTATPVNTVSVTLSATRTVTSSPTLTNTGTPTRTRTYTRTATPSRTMTATPTASPVYSPTESASATASVSPTRTYTITETRTASVSPTVYISYTVTQTPTGTPPTETITPTITETDTDTPVNTVTPTDTPVDTRTNTPVDTVTRTASPTMTITVTFTRTFTPIITLTLTFNPSPTFTSTFTEGKIGIEEVIVFPCPLQNSADPLKLAVQFTGRPVKVYLNIYTAGFRRVRQEICDTGITYPICTLSLTADRIKGLSNGSYYCVLQAEDDFGKKSNKVTKPFLILK